MKALCISLLTLISACDVSVPNASVNTTIETVPATSPADVASPSPSPSPTPIPVVLDVYSLTSSSSGLIGYCTVYNEGTWCWDNGVQEIEDGLTMSFWGISNSGNCNVAAHCEADSATTPTLWTDALAEESAQAGFGITSGYVLSQGISTQTDCTLLDSVLNCGTFTINLGGGQ
jgi:hypothetical protein